MENKDLIEKFVEGSLSENESEILFNELNHNSEMTDELQQSLYMDELLEQSFNPEKSEDAFLAELTEKLVEENRSQKQRTGKFNKAATGKFNKAATGKFNKLNTGKHRRIPNRKRKKSSPPIMIFSAIAACLVVGFTVIILSKSSTSSSTTVAKGSEINSNLYVQDIKGTVNVNRDGKITALSDGDFILQGDKLSAGAESSASLQFISERTKIELSPRSMFVIESDISKDTDVKKFTVETGKVYFDVAHQKEGHKFLINTDRAVARVIGTRLNVQKEKGFSQVKVFEGLVRVKSILSGDVVDVPGNHMVRITDTSYPDVLSINGKTPKVIGFSLVNARTDKLVTGFENLRDGMVLDKSQIPRFLSVRINTSNSHNIFGVKNTLKDSRGRKLDFTTNMEKILPYTMTGDRITGDYHEWEPAPGEYVLEVEVYNLMHFRTDSETLTFTIR